LVEAKYTVEPSGKVSDVELLRSEPSDSFGSLAKRRYEAEIYPPREEPTKQHTTERFRNIEPHDWIFIGSPARIDSREYTYTDFEAAQARGVTLWSCGEYTAHFSSARSLCGGSSKPPVVSGGLGHSSCRSGLELGRPYLVWAHSYETGWSVVHAHPIYPIEPERLAITAWAAWDLLLDRTLQSIPGLAETADPYFSVDIMSSSEFERYRASPLYGVRNGAVYPAVGAYISDVEAALTATAAR